MKKITIFIVFAIFCLTSVAGQNSTNTETKDETISKLQNEVSKLEKEIEYYKKTLDLLNSKITAQDQNVEFKINSVIGDLNTGKVTIEGIVINNGVLRSLQGHQANAFDPQGNEIQTFDVIAGADRIKELQKDIPAKFKIVFKSTVPNTPILKSLNLKFYSWVELKQADVSVTFRNIPIEWK